MIYLNQQSQIKALVRADSNPVLFDHNDQNEPIETNIGYLILGNLCKTNNWTSYVLESERWQGEMNINAFSIQPKHTNDDRLEASIPPALVKTVELLNKASLENRSKKNRDI